MYKYILFLFIILFLGCSNNSNKVKTLNNSNNKNDNTLVNENTSLESSIKTYSIKGKIIDGYINNASICLDINLNNICDNSEMKVKSDLEGNFIFNNIQITNDHLLSFISSGGVDTFTQKNVDYSLRNISLINKLSKDKIIYITPLSNIISNLFFKSDNQNITTFNLIKNKIIQNLSLEAEDIYKNHLLNKSLFIKINQLNQIQNIMSNLEYSRDNILNLIADNIFEKSISLDKIISNIAPKLSKPMHIENIKYIENNLSNIYKKIKDNTSNYQSARLEQLIKTQTLIEELSEKITDNIKNNEREEIDIEKTFNSEFSSLIGFNSHISDIQILKNREKKIIILAKINSTDTIVKTASSSNLNIINVEIVDNLLIIKSKKDAVGTSIVTINWKSNHVNITSSFNVYVIDNYSKNNKIEISLLPKYKGIVTQKINILPKITNDHLAKEYEWIENNIIISKSLILDYIPKSSGKHILTLRVIDKNLDIVEKSTIIDVKFSLAFVIIMIEFNDYKFENGDTTWSSKFFANKEGSVTDYYREISYGNFSMKKAKENYNIDNDGIIKIKLNKNHPGNIGQQFKNNLIEAINLADDYIDFSEYDIDKNGHISIDELQIVFLVAGGESATGVSPGVWAHCSAFLNINAPIKDGVSLMNSSFNGRYAMFGEKHFVTNQHDATIGIIVHELGHSIFKLPDLYDSDQTSSGIGYFGLMGSGSWGRKNIDEYFGETPVHMTAWSKIKSYFISPSYINNDINQLELEESSFEKYKAYKINITNSQYFLLENRNNSGYDRGLNIIGEKINEAFKGGVLILHIDDQVINNSKETHKLVDIEEANNLGLDNSLHKGHPNNLFFENNKILFNPNTVPNSNKYDGVKTGIEINNISGTGPIMNLDIKLNKEI